jgi:hypothetical protein
MTDINAEAAIPRSKRRGAIEAHGGEGVPTVIDTVLVQLDRQSGFSIDSVGNRMATQ